MSEHEIAGIHREVAELQQGSRRDGAARRTEEGARSEFESRLAEQVLKLVGLFRDTRSEVERVIRRVEAAEARLAALEGDRRP
jgi:hypothetical protein